MSPSDSKRKHDWICPSNDMKMSIIDIDIYECVWLRNERQYASCDWNEARVRQWFIQNVLFQPCSVNIELAVQHRNLSLSLAYPLDNLFP